MIFQGSSKNTMLIPYSVGRATYCGLSSVYLPAKEFWLLACRWETMTCLSTRINHSELIIDKASVDCKQVLRPWECGAISILCSTSIILSVILLLLCHTISLCAQKNMICLCKIFSSEAEALIELWVQMDGWAGEI